MYGNTERVWVEVQQFAHPFRVGPEVCFQWFGNFDGQIGREKLKQAEHIVPMLLDIAPLGIGIAIVLSLRQVDERSGFEWDEEALIEDQNIVNGAAARK